MKYHQNNNHENGFGALYILVVIIVIAGIGFTGLYVYHRDHKVKTVATTVSTLTSKTKTITATQTTNPYASWKTYCDTVYYYCFKYPTNWQLTSKPASAGQVPEGSANLASPTGTVEVTYSNAFVHDSSSIPLTVTSITKLTSANQALDVVGGYNPSSGDNGIAGNNIPFYKVVSDSLLSTYPLTAGQTSEFPSNPYFTDQYEGETSDYGSLKAIPATSISTVAQAQSWLSSADAKTAQLILESIYYNK